MRYATRMDPSNRLSLRERAGVKARRGTLLLACLFAPGCASPPSVSPLLRVADRALADESRLVADDAARQAAWVEQQRRSLGDAFALDLKGRETLDPRWVMTGAEAYVAAREALLRHEVGLQRQTQLRRDNLAAASRAITRAVELIEKQDALFEPIPDIRRWNFNTNIQEPNR